MRVPQRYEYTAGPAADAARIMPAHPHRNDMPKVLRARRLHDDIEECRLRKLAGSRRAPAEQVVRARTIVLSWDGESTATIAARLGCHPQTVRDRIARFNAEGFRSVVDRASGGRKPRLTDQQRRALIALVEHQDSNSDREADTPPASSGGHTGGGTEPQATSWTLDALVAAAQHRGIEVRRSQVRRILLAAGIQWHPTHAWKSG
jgi:transposase